MARAQTPMHQFETTAQDTQMEIFGLVWADAKTRSQEARNTEKQLRSIINNVKKFDNGEESAEYIEKTSKNDRIILIVSGQLGQSLVPRVFKLRQVISIYVFCSNKDFHKQWAANYTKVKAVLTELNTLVNRIKEDHKTQKIVDEPLAVSFFNADTDVEKSMKDLSGKFVFLQVLIECLLRLKSTQTDIDELIRICRSNYEDNEGELQNIREFQQGYSVNNALWWYTRDSFFHKALNAILRTENISMIVLFRSYIYDIQEQLKKYQAKYPLRVYRGQMISNKELEDLKKISGQFISINSFFSTTTDYKQALSFLSNRDNTDNLQRVIFEIDADPKMATEKPFSDIRKQSAFPDEAEILFMLGSIFRLKKIDRKDNDNVTFIRMTLCSESEHEIKKVLTYMKEKLVGDRETNLRTLGKVLWKMGRLNLAEQYYMKQLKQMKEDDPLRGDVYEDLGDLTGEMKDLDKSVKWHEKAMEFKKLNKPKEKITTERSNKSEKRASSAHSQSRPSSFQTDACHDNRPLSHHCGDSSRVCYACRQSISSQWTTYLNRSYHPNCLRCTNCHKVLAHHQRIYEHNSQPYCDACHNSLYAEKCTICGNPINGGLTFEGRSYHKECFRCTHCHKVLAHHQRIYEHNSQPYCDACHNSLYAEKCTICGNPINGGLTFEGRAYHNECFKCTNCHKSLNGSKTYSKNSKPYCAQCN